MQLCDLFAFLLCVLCAFAVIIFLTQRDSADSQILIPVQPGQIQTMGNNGACLGSKWGVRKKYKLLIINNKVNKIGSSVNRVITNMLFWGVGLTCH